MIAQQNTALAGIRLLNIGFMADNLNKIFKKFVAVDLKQKSEHKARFFEAPIAWGGVLITSRVTRQIATIGSLAPTLL